MNPIKLATGICSATMGFVYGIEEGPSAVREGVSAIREGNEIAAHGGVFNQGVGHLSRCAGWGQAVGGTLGTVTGVSLAIRGVAAVHNYLHGNAQ